MCIVYRRKGGISSKKWYKVVKKWKKSVDFTYLFRVCGFAQQNKVRTPVFFSHKYKKTTNLTRSEQIMAKMREFLFWNEKGQEEKKENTSFKKAVKSIQENFKNQLIGFEYISKKGKKIVSSIQLPLGRKKKIGR